MNKQQKLLEQQREQLYHVEGEDEQSNFSNDDVYSDEQQFSSDQRQGDTQIIQKRIPNIIKQQDQSYKQKGQTQQLMPLAISNLNKKIPQNNLGGNNQKIEKQIIQQKNKDLPIKKQRQKRIIKLKEIFYNSKSIYAAYDLLKKQLTTILKPQEGFIKFNPYENNKSIVIYYYDENKIEEIETKLDDYINQIQFLPMKKVDAQLGIQLSYKYFKNLQKQKITIFHDTTQNYRTQGYYICGIVKQQILYQKIKQIQNTTFSWINLFKYQNTRSYRAILRKIFDFPDFHDLFLQKFEGKQIQISSLKKNFSYPANFKTKNISVVLTYLGRRKINNIKQMEQFIVNYISDTYAVFCFSFLNKKQNKGKYTPKIDKVTWFFIHQTKLQLPISYIYIIVKRSDFQNVKQSIINEIQNMKLDLTRRRFFRNLHPSKQEVEDIKQFFYTQFPKKNPYSWTFIPKSDKYDWKSHLKI